METGITITMDNNVKINDLFRLVNYKHSGNFVKLRYIVPVSLILAIVLIHFNSFTFPHSVILRHVILILVLCSTGYYAYDSRRRYLADYNSLRKLLKVCSWCNTICYTDPIRNKEEWVTVEKYMELEHKFSSSHGICPDCFNQIDYNI